MMDSSTDSTLLVTGATVWSGGDASLWRDTPVRGRVVNVLRHGESVVAGGSLRNEIRPVRFQARNRYAEA